MRHCISTSLHHFITELLHHCCIAPLQRCFIATLRNWNAETLHHCISAPLLPCFTTCLHQFITESLKCCSAARRPYKSFSHFIRPAIHRYSAKTSATWVSKINYAFLHACNKAASMHRFFNLNWKLHASESCLNLKVYWMWVNTFRCLNAWADDL